MLLLPSLFLNELVASGKDGQWELGSDDVVHFLVVDKDLGRQSFQNPDVLEGLVWGESLRWVPLQALLDEIREVRVFVSYHKSERFPHGLAEFASRILHHDWLRRYAVRGFGEEFLLAGGNAEDSLVWDADHFDQPGHLIVFAISREYWIPDIEFRHDAAERPHVDGAVVGNAQHDLRCSVEP